MARVLQRRDRNRIALIAVEEELAGAVRVDIDQAGRNAHASRQRKVDRPISREDLRNAAALDDEPSRGGRSVAEREPSRS